MTANEMNKPSSISEWKKSVHQTVELPSGKFLGIRRIGMQALIAMGTIPNSLMGLMQSALAKGGGVEDKVMTQMAENPDNMVDLVKMFNKVICTLAQEPQVHMPPKSEADRSPDLLYADEIDEMDKLFLFQLVQGGTSDLVEFRKQHAAGLESLSKL